VILLFFIFIHSIFDPGSKSNSKLKTRKLSTPNSSLLTHILPQPLLRFLIIYKAFHWNRWGLEREECTRELAYIFLGFRAGGRQE
jgi:hypothetical protein